MSELEELRLAYAECSRQRNELLNKLKSQAQPAQQEPVAWRTFDGEGGYEYRSYEMNEQYLQEWEQRNPKHKGWVEPLYTVPSPCPTCEALARTVMLDQTSHDAQRKPLTDAEISNAWCATDSIKDFVKYIEAVHDIKESI